ncbi:MAG TPA: phosphatidylglycerol lysyltransferase domain-containing protein [Gaiellales bacterium]
MSGRILDTRPLRLAPTALAHGRTRRLLATTAAASVALTSVWHALVIDDGALGTVAMLVLLGLAPSLGRGRRRALYVSLVLLAGVAALDLALAEQRAAFVALVLAIALAAAAPAFPARGDPTTRRRLVVGAVVGAGAVAADLAHARGVIDHPVLGAAALTTLLLVAVSAGPWRDRRGRDAGTRTTAASIVELHGSDTLAPFALRPDKRIFLSQDRRAFLGYTTIAGVALVSGAPIGPDDCHDALLDDFVRDAERRGLVVAALGVPAEGLDGWRSRGFRAHYTGDEAIVDPAAFSLDGRAIRKVRQSVLRLERAGYRMEMVRGRDLTVARAGTITRIAESWRRGRRETGFSMAFESATPDAGRDDLYALAIGPDGEPHGFLHLADVSAGHALSLSAMRRLPETPNGLNEFLICETLAWARARGYRSVSLNFAAFAAVLDPPARLDRVAALEARVLRRLSGRFQLERLRAFSGKFDPHWTPRYAVYPSTASLPRVAFAAMLAEAYVALPWSRRSRA